MPFAQLRDARIHYSLEGEESHAVLVLSNSLGTNFSMWDPQMESFLKQFRVLRYDTRGHGQSSITPGPYTIEQLSKDIIGLLDSLGFNTAHFCGLSMGGMTAMWLALNTPQRLNKVIFCNTAVKIGTADTWQSRIDAVKTKGMATVATSTMERWFSADFRERQPAATARIQQMVSQANPEGYIANCEAVRDFDFRDRIAHISCNGLVISGKHDPATPPADGRFIAQKVQNTRFVELDAAHLSNIEASDQFTQTVLDFLACARLTVH
jgi:3-oxoadipate enol-lactonase